MRADSQTSQCSQYNRPPSLPSASQLALKLAVALHATMDAPMRGEPPLQSPACSDRLNREKSSLPFCISLIAKIRKSLEREGL